MVLMLVVPIPSTVDCTSAFGAAREITDVPARVGRQPASRLNDHRNDRRARADEGISLYCMYNGCTVRHAA